MKHKSIVSVLLLCCLLAARMLAAETLPLAGEWRFALDRSDAGTKQDWFAKTLPDKIQLPGILEAQGYGDEISTRTPWVLSLYDHAWFLRADYAAYTNAGSVKAPFLCQPQRHYLGAAWYQRELEIPADWSGKRVVLFLERPHWKSTVWLDDRQIGSDISLCTPHEFELGIAERPFDSAAHQQPTGGTPAPLPITPGKHRLTIRVDNRMILPYRPDAHSVSDSLDNAWNGIVGKIELRATPPVWVEDVQVFPNLTDKSITVRTKIGNATGQAGQGVASISIGLAFTPEQHRVTFGRFGPSTNFPVKWDKQGAIFDTKVPATCITDPQLWSEFYQELYGLGVSISTNSLPSLGGMKSVTFGLREFRAEGNQFILNGRPIYFRGTHFGGDFPLTGYPPTDVDSWKKIIRTCQDYGLNHMRFHSWCPPEAAFAAADELGFYLQVECGMWNEFSPGGEMEKMLYAETDRILKAYGNHPSFLLLSASNEAHGRWQQALPHWVEHFRAADPRRLYTPDTGWVAIESPGPVTGADYLVTGRIGASRTRGETGWFGRDYGHSLRGVNVPVVAHELGQWCAYPDFDVIKKFAGFMRPGNFEIYRDSAAAHGVLEHNHDFARASGRFQLACYKEEIEANLRTPGMAGFQLLDLHDYTGQGTALVGLLDPFWGSKGYVTPGEFKKFCNTIVPLACLKQRVFTTADQLQVPVEAANFGPGPITNAQMSWAIRNSSGKILLQSAAAPQHLPLGKGCAFGAISADLSQLAAPAQYRLEVAIGPQPLNSFGKLPSAFANEWNFWLYPAIQPPAASIVDFLDTSSFDEAKQALTQGKKVLFTPQNSELDWNSPPLARLPIFWNALMGPTWSRMLGLWCDTNSPALAEFPTEPDCDWQWTEVLRNTRAINLDHLPRALTPIVSAIDDWNRNYKLGLIFEAKIGAGKLLVCATDLGDNSNPVAQQLRRSLLDYMAGGKFAPQTEISMAEFESLRFNTRIMRQLGATATADGRRANELIDGDPNTFWSSADLRGNGPKPPHEFLVSFPRPVAMNGLIVMPRQNQREHQGDIQEFTVAASGEGTNWQEVASGQLASTFDEQRIPFGKTVTAKYLKLNALSGFGDDHAAALAELAVIYTGPKLAETPPGKVEYQHVRTASPDIDAGDAAKPPRNQE